MTDVNPEILIFVAIWLKYKYSVGSKTIVLADQKVPKKSIFTGFKVFAHLLFYKISCLVSQIMTL